MRAGLGPECREGFAQGQRWAPRAIVGHGVERVDDRKNPRGKWDRIALELVRVAGAIPSFVMVTDDVKGGCQQRDGLDDIDAGRGMSRDQLALLGRQPIRFAEDRLRRPYLAD